LEEGGAQFLRFTRVVALKQKIPQLFMTIDLQELSEIMGDDQLPQPEPSLFKSSRAFSMRVEG
jgi:hypothetical protein